MRDPGASLGERGEEVGEYTLDTRLGAGSYGAVWRARHKLMRDQEVAIKLFPPDTAGRRIVREAQALGSVQSPHVPRLLGGNAEAEPPYIAMEFIQGESLRELLTRRRKLAEDEAVDLATQVLQGLDAAHEKGVLHRDIKPENLIVQGTLGAKGCRVVLVDFGLARLDGAATDGSLQLSGGLRSAHGIAGTPVYMAPEVLLGKSATPASDLFSVGIVLYECLTGRTPTAVRMFTFPMQEVSEGLSDWLKKTLAEELSSRWGNARIMQSGLMSATAPSHSGQAQGSREQKFSRAPLTNRGAWIFGFVFALVIFLGAVVNVSVEERAKERAAAEKDRAWKLWQERRAAEDAKLSPAEQQARAEEQSKNCVDVNGVAEFDYVPGRKSGDARIATLPSEDDGHSLCLLISPGTGFGDTTWWVRISPVDAGENDVIAEFQLPRDQVHSVKTRLRDAVYDRSDPSLPHSLRQTFTTELTQLDLGPNNTVKKLAVRVKVHTER